MANKSKKSSNDGVVQSSLFDMADDVAKPEKKPATELMKRVAEKAPSKRKIMHDFSPAEQAEIFKNIQNDNSAIKDTIQQQKDEIADEVRRELIRKVKRLAKEMELGNNSRIILFPSYSRNGTKLEWYKMGDFSALYYTYRMADRMGRRTPTIQKDKDRFYRMRTIVSIRDIDAFIAQAMKLGEFAKHEETLDKIHILQMKHALKDDEVAILARTGEMQKEMMHSVLRPKKAVPEMYLSILTLGRQVVRMNRALEVIYRYEVGDKVTENVLEMMNTYFDYTGGLIEVEAARNEMKRRVFRVRAGMAILGDGDAVKPAKACAIGETVVKIETLISEMK